jgi:hypothetical protein
MRCGTIHTSDFVTLSQPLTFSPMTIKWSHIASLHLYAFYSYNRFTDTFSKYTVTRTEAKFQHIWWMSQDQTTGLTEFSNMCMSTGTVDISNMFQYPQWNFPTLSNMNIGIFLNISLHIVEFPTFSNIYRGTTIVLDLSFRCLLFLIQQQPKQNHD